MNELLHHSSLILIVVTLLYVIIAGIPMTERMRIILVYIFSFAFALSGAVSVWTIVVGSFVVLVLSLEFLSIDSWRLRVFTNMWFKFLDFCYRMFIEYAYTIYLVSMVLLFIGHNLNILVLQIPFYTVAIICLAVSLVSVTSQKYVTKSIGEIIAYFEHDILSYTPLVTPHMRTLFSILVSMEDKAYFDRKPNQHTIPITSALRKGLSYLKKNRDAGVYGVAKSVFKRGYGTIEMQLLRTIGIELGYGYTVRRKAFEVVYANILINGYYGYLYRARGNYYRFREFLLYKYIESVDVRINSVSFGSKKNASSLLQAFKKPNYERITKEEFFVWCLGLPKHTHISTDMIDYHQDTIDENRLDRNKIDALLRKFK